MEDLSSREYAEAYFAEEEEMKMGTHPSQIIPRATEELKSRGYDVDNIIIWDWHDNDGTVKIKFSDGEIVSYDYMNNQIISNHSKTKTKHEYLMDWVHGLYDDVPLNTHINDYNKIHPNNQITRDDVMIVKGALRISLNSHYGSCISNTHVNRKSLGEEAKHRVLLKSYMLKYQQIFNYLNENV